MRTDASSPRKRGSSVLRRTPKWIPACAGMTVVRKCRLSRRDDRASCVIPAKAGIQCLTTKAKMDSRMRGN
ncbi:MAG: hypothetical protein E6H74_02915 [Betaproteobacteria bacterium]|nr:MAG: hypothetical protein E6H74_02915 [Betaproteobacteria bacterium]